LILKKVLFDGIKASVFALALADSSRAFRGLKRVRGLGLGNTALVNNNGSSHLTIFTSLWWVW